MLFNFELKIIVQTNKKNDNFNLRKKERNRVNKTGARRVWDIFFEVESSSENNSILAGCVKEGVPRPYSSHCQI